MVNFPLPIQTMWPHYRWEQCEPRVRTVRVRFHEKRYYRVEGGITKQVKPAKAEFFYWHHRRNGLAQYSFPWVSLAKRRKLKGVVRPVLVFFHSRPWKSQAEADDMAMTHAAPFHFCHVSPRALAEGPCCACVGFAINEKISIPEMFWFTSFSDYKFDGFGSEGSVSHSAVGEREDVQGPMMEVLRDTQHPERAIEFNWEIGT